MALPAINTFDEATTGEDVEFLDLDGDGILDAIRTTERTVMHLIGADVVHVREELDAGIDDDGIPHMVELTETVLGARR